MNESRAQERCRAVMDAVSEAVVIDDEVVRQILIGVVGGGHVLLEDVPGTGKTLTARTFAHALGLEFSRIQFTPDLLPADITGSEVFNEERREFEFRPGPLFANVVLADEINRASAKTQSALLEAMAEGQVSVGNDSYPLPTPFFVLATQNPIESAGTFELPAAQKDRFMIKTSLGYPDLDGELAVLERRASRQQRAVDVEPVCTPTEIEELREAPEHVQTSDAVKRYLATLTRATREHNQVATGVSPRGTERLFEAARAVAVIRGRTYITPDDVKEIAPAILTHRLALTPDARVAGHTSAEVIEEVLETVEVPKLAEPSPT